MLPVRSQITSSSRKAYNYGTHHFLCCLNRNHISSYPPTNRSIKTNNNKTTLYMLLEYLEVIIRQTFP